MSYSTTYSEKLRDPRWQKLRLQVFERDKWTCQACADTESTLMVHHLVYSRGEPWESPLEELETLCEWCHEFREEFNGWIGGRATVPTVVARWLHRLISRGFASENTLWEKSGRQWLPFLNELLREDAMRVREEEAEDREVF